MRGYAIAIDLINIDMPDFNLTLGMDFLSRYRVEIDCRKKKIRFSMIMLSSSHSERVKSSTFSYTKAKKILSKKCMTYFVHIILKL